jgi:hypothetical protein
MLTIKATLRIFSKEMSLDDLTKKLGNPTSGYSIGDEYSKSKKKREMSFWALKSSSKGNESLDFHIRKLLSFIDSKNSEIVEISDKCDFDIFCMLSSDNGQGTTVISEALQKLLSKYKLNIVLDLYMEPEGD